MSKLSKLLTVLLTFVSIATFSQSDLKIKGKVTNHESTTITLYDISGQNEITNAEIGKNGSFTMNASIGKTNFYRLSLDEYSVVFLILEPGNNVKVELDGENLKEPVIEGSKHSELAYNSLKEVGEMDKKLEEYTIKIEEEKRTYIRNFVKNNPTSLATLFYLEELDNEEDFELFKSTVESLNKEYPENELVGELYGQLNRAEIKEGEVAPEISLPNADGKTINLTSLQGKYVLIDFWASWCGPCRMEMPNLTAAYSKYKDKGFEIYSVSLDNKAEPWLKAVEEDNITWIAVLDAQSTYAGTYGVQGIPFTVLIDKEGKIIATNLRGDDLESKLAELLD